VVAAAESFANRGWHRTSFCGTTHRCHTLDDPRILVSAGARIWASIGRFGPGPLGLQCRGECAGLVLTSWTRPGLKTNFHPQADLYTLFRDSLLPGCGASLTCFVVVSHAWLCSEINGRYVRRANCCVAVLAPLRSGLNICRWNLLLIYFVAWKAWLEKRLHENPGARMNIVYIVIWQACTGCEVTWNVVLAKASDNSDKTMS